MLDLFSIAALCAPNVATDTILSIIKTESNGNHLVINDNTTRSSYKPVTKDDAINISFILIKKGHNLDFGLMQINLVNAKKFHLTLNKLFDPCENIKVGSKILTDNFIKTSRENSNEQIALLKAVSMYNTGSSHKGFSNGYVKKVLGNAKIIKIPPDYSEKVID